MGRPAATARDMHLLRLGRIASAATLIAALALLATGCIAPDRTELERGMAEAAAAAARAASTASTAPHAATPTATPTSSPAPPPVPTATPSVSIADVTAAAAAAPAVRATAVAVPATEPAAEPAAEAERSGARRPEANAASVGFAPPPPKITASLPNSGRILRIVSPTLGLDHYIDVLRIVNNQMEAPDNDGSYAVGWYPDFSPPGVGGNAVFSAHETWAHMQGPFYFMHAAQAGDEIYLDMATGERFTYQVISTARYTVETIPMGEVLWPSNRPQAEQWITLITCGGRIEYHADGFGDYLDRDVVVLRRVS